MSHCEKVSDIKVWRRQQRLSNEILILDELLVTVQVRIQIPTPLITLHRDVCCSRTAARECLGTRRAGVQTCARVKVEASSIVVLPI